MENQQNELVTLNRRAPSTGMIDWLIDWFYDPGVFCLETHVHTQDIERDIYYDIYGWLPKLKSALNIATFLLLFLLCMAAWLMFSLDRHYISNREHLICVPSHTMSYNISAPVHPATLWDRALSTPMHHQATLRERALAHLCPKAETCVAPSLTTR